MLTEKKVENAAHSAFELYAAVDEHGTPDEDGEWLVLAWDYKTVTIAPARDVWP